MSSHATKTLPPDQAERDRALDAKRSALVRAPAGSGKTTLLAERFLRLLLDVDEPGQVVAITFTEAAAAEMRNRILDELQKNEPSEVAQRVLDHAQRLGWKLLELPAQLRIQTIDSFCRDLALAAAGFGPGRRSRNCQRCERAISPRGSADARTNRRAGCGVARSDRKVAALARQQLEGD